jgi:hypothetical protein
MLGKDRGNTVGENRDGGLTWSIADCCIKWNSEDSDIKQCIRLGQAFLIVEMCERRDARKTPLLKISFDSGQCCAQV